MYKVQNAESIDITDESLAEYLRSRYADRSFDDFSRSLHELAVELRGGGFATIGDLHQALERTEKAAELFEAENPPSQLVGSRYSAIGIVVVSMALMALLLGTGFFTFGTVLDKCPPEELEEYGKHVLPEADKPQPTED